MIDFSLKAKKNYGKKSVFEKILFNKYFHVIISNHPPPIFSFLFSIKGMFGPLSVKEKHNVIIFVVLANWMMSTKDLLVAGGS